MELTRLARTLPAGRDPARREAGRGAGDRRGAGAPGHRHRRGAAELAAADGEHRTTGAGIRRPAADRRRHGDDDRPRWRRSPRRRQAGGHAACRCGGCARGQGDTGCWRCPASSRPTEAFAMLAAGADALKLFPAEAASSGGAARDAGGAAGGDGGAAGRRHRRVQHGGVARGRGGGVRHRLGDLQAGDSPETVGAKAHALMAALAGRSAGGSRAVSFPRSNNRRLRHGSRHGGGSR